MEAALDFPSRIGGYAVRGVLGRGGSATVLAVHDGERGLALKLFHEAEAALGRWQAEREALRALRHPAVIPVLDAGTWQARPWLVMPVAPGEPPRPRPELAPAEALAPLLDLLEVLEVLHERGWVHGDLKPENLRVVGPRIRVLDLGLARRSGVARRSGTRAWMAPEQLLGRAALPATDLYAVGLLVIWVLTGSLPWAELNQEEALRRRLSGPPPLADLGEPLRPLLRQVLGPLRGRPETAAELREGLRSSLAGAAQTELSEDQRASLEAIAALGGRVTARELSRLGRPLDGLELLVQGRLPEELARRFEPRGPLRRRLARQAAEGAEGARRRELLERAGQVHEAARLGLEEAQELQRQGRARQARALLERCLSALGGPEREQALAALDALGDA